MQALGRSSFRWVLLLVLSLGSTLTAPAAKAPLLRYNSDNTTNVFSVLIEIRGESGKEALAGNLTMFTRPVSTNLLSLTFRGSLNPKRDFSSPPYMGVGRPSRWMMPVNLNEGAELLVDQQGRIRRVSGDFPLPVPLGSLAQLFVPQLPAKAETKWEFSQDVPVLDEPLGLGPTWGVSWNQFSGGMMPGYGMPGFRNSMAVLVVSRVIKAKVKESTPKTVTVRQSVILDSPLRAGAESRINASSEGTWTFDLAGGFVRAVELEFQSLLNSESSTRRNTGTLKVQLLEGKEREAALVAQSNRAMVDPATGQVVSRKLTGEELQKVFTDLQSDDEARRQAAANRLASSEVINPPVALVNYLTKYLFDDESPLRYAAAKIVADFGTIENVPDLLRLLKTTDGSTAWSAIRGLGRLKDPRAIEPLVELVAAGDSEAHQAASALENFGPAAEDAVLGLLKEKHTSTKRAACGILKKIGTQKSLEPLKQLVGDSDFSLSNSASEALRSVQARL